MNFYEVIPPPEVAVNFSPYQVHAHHFLSCPPLSVLQQATQIFPSRYLPRFASMADAPREQFIATRTTKLPLPHSSGHQRAGLELDEYMQLFTSDVYPTRQLQSVSVPSVGFTRQGVVMIIDGKEWVEDFIFVLHL